MNRTEAQAILPALTAFAEGKKVQVMGNLGGWFDASVIDPCAVTRYRVKPTPVLRPWAADTAPLCFITRHKTTGDYKLVVYGRTEEDGTRVSWETLAEDWSRILEDGTESPCGVMEDAS